MIDIYNNCYPNIIKLLKIALVMAPHNMDTERTISK